MKNSKKLILTLLILFLLLAGEVIFVRSASQYEAKMEVVYAKSKIMAKTVITGDMLEKKKVNVSMLHTQSVFNSNDVIGKSATSDIEPGEMLLKSRVGEVKELPQIKITDASNRLFTVAFAPDQANGWWLNVDQYVDIIFVPNENGPLGVAVPKPIPDNAGTADKTNTFMNDKVKALEHIRIAALIDENGNLLENEDRDTLPTMISFEVTPEQNKFLAWAKTRGRIEVSSISSEGKSYKK